MVLPLIAIAAAGVGGGLLGGLLGGGSKKEIHATKEHYAPVHAPVSSIAKTYAPTYQYQIDSPYAEMTSKKDLVTKAAAKGEVTTPRVETTTEGMDMTKIAIIGVIGLVTYGLVSKK